MNRPDLYFSLIHARTPFPNQWVERFYRRLDEEVRSRAEPVPGLRPGSLFFATEGEARLALAGSPPGVRVLVPLYTREFLHDPPPDFSDHLYRRAEPGELPFVHPVLWDTYVPARTVGGLAQARSLGNSVQEYADCGMAALCRLNAYAVELRQLVQLLAERIVHAAQNPDQAPEWTRGEPTQEPGAPEARFIVYLVRRPGAGAEWAPFGPEPGVLGDWARRAAQRLILLPELVDYLTAPAIPAGGVPRAAGVVLLDPIALDEPVARQKIKRLFERLPAWISVVLVIGRDSEEHEAEAVRALTDEARMLAPDGVRLARNAPEFGRVIDEAIHRARNNYLRLARRDGG
ncbi:hypothetical protein JIG36_36895 [Actinoplanes sp. LDG1-06]|uniref:Uncharacterized protein n=1 Tax=Paractinoplanes ovalisporus TaxID=2810368 RepID=A0ABS2AMU5_9ACTN|nr:hypothetical protein [Actinoplanes ovalisporus]MBM2621093.1 hypothetical protein [Actinoplanes ovalisporus]